MTELERFAAALLAQWQSHGGTGGGPIAVGEILERILPYRIARRALGIDASEDYEAMVLRLIAEDGDLVRTEPVEAADMAKTTIASKLPDLDVLQLLRAATVTITPRAAAALAAVAAGQLDAAPAPLQEEPAPTPEMPPLAEPGATESPEPLLTSADSPQPPVALDPVAKSVRQRFSGTDNPASASTWAPSRRPPPTHEEAFPVSTPSNAAAENCWSCHETLPPGRNAKFCPLCGADQRQPLCASCGAAVERRWKHCPDCGTRLGAGG